MKVPDVLSENFQFLVVKFSIYLNRHVFIMSDQPVHPPNTARVSFITSFDSLEAVEGHAISEDFDRTARMLVAQVCAG